MAHILTFSTAVFDVSSETPNPINPIAGQGVLMWLREKLEDTPYSATSPEPEDWGWYIDVSASGVSYLVGASGDAEAPSSDVEWTIQVERHRSLVDRLTGWNKMEHDDPLVSTIATLLRGMPGVRDVRVETALRSEKA